MLAEDFIQNRFGYCFYEIQKSTAIIYNLYVHPEYRRQGKAKRLLHLVVSEIRKSGYHGEIEIEAAPKEHDVDIEGLHRLYSKMGFKILLQKKERN